MWKNFWEYFTGWNLKEVNAVPQSTRSTQGRWTSRDRNLPSAWSFDADRDLLCCKPEHLNRGSFLHIINLSETNLQRSEHECKVWPGKRDPGFCAFARSNHLMQLLNDVSLVQSNTTITREGWSHCINSNTIIYQQVKRQKGFDRFE